jgi:hypothetical protein
MPKIFIENGKGFAQIWSEIGGGQMVFDVGQSAR